MTGLKADAARMAAKEARDLRNTPRPPKEDKNSAARIKQLKENCRTGSHGIHVRYGC